jgi:pSer/pThr/pTyr-binding forkhead associated (FHA) protein
VRRDAGRLVVRDAGSSNGTFVRGQRLAPGQEVILAPGEELVLADEHFRVEEGRAL